MWLGHNGNNAKVMPNNRLKIFKNTWRAGLCTLRLIDVVRPVFWRRDFTAVTGWTGVASLNCICCLPATIRQELGLHSHSPCQPQPSSTAQVLKASSAEVNRPGVHHRDLPVHYHRHTTTPLSTNLFPFPNSRNNNHHV